MGSFSIFHWMIVLCVFAIPAAIVGLIFWLASRSNKRPPAATPRTMPPAMPSSPDSSIESRLQALTDLKSKGLITEAEYDQQRAFIIQSC